MRKFVALLLVAILGQQVAQAEGQSADYLQERPVKRVALVVGNRDYQHHAPIPSSSVDANKVATALKSLGFAVTEVHDVVDSAEFWEVHFKPFRAKISENDFAVFYFSGHGQAYAGENLLVMIGAESGAVAENKALDTRVAVTSIRDLMAARKPGLSLILLDACRSISGSIQKPDGTVEAIAKGPTSIGSMIGNVLIGFSSDFGTVSLGRSGEQEPSYYTEALIAAIESKRDEEFDKVKKLTRSLVIYNTKEAQVPWFSDSHSAEVYLNPSDQVREREKTAWVSSLSTNDYYQIWNFSVVHSLSDYAAAAKRWLNENASKRNVELTKVAPSSVDSAWNAGSSVPVSVPRIDGPFAFGKIGSQATLSAYDGASQSGLAAQLLASQGHIVVTRPIIGRSAADENAPSTGLVTTGTIVPVDAVVQGVRGESWLQTTTPGGRTTYLPANRVVVGSTPLGFSLLEVNVPPVAESSTLVDEKTITAALAELRRAGRSISRVSVSSPSAEDSRAAARISGRLAHSVLVLAQTGIDRGTVTAVTSGDFTGEGIRIRFFGK